MTTAILASRRWFATNANFFSPLIRLAARPLALAAISAISVAVTLSLFRWIANSPTLNTVLIATASTAAATAIGALPVLATRNFSRKATTSLFGFGGGIMLAATTFSLIIPGIESAAATTGSRLSGAGAVAVALLAGGMLMLAVGRHVPFAQFNRRLGGGSAEGIKRTWLFVAAVAFHNFPEGLAVGVGIGSGDAARGVPLAMGIGVQNIPEGFVVALALAATGYTAGFSAAVGAATGLLEPVGGILGAVMVSTSVALLPWGLGLAAGAMLFVVSHEIIPEAHRRGHERLATSSLMAGFVTMMTLDTAFG